MSINRDIQLISAIDLVDHVFEKVRFCLCKDHDVRIELVNLRLDFTLEFLKTNIQFIHGHLQVLRQLLIIVFQGSNPGLVVDNGNTKPTDDADGQCANNAD